MCRRSSDLDPDRDENFFDSSSARRKTSGQFNSGRLRICIAASLSIARIDREIFRESASRRNTLRRSAFFTSISWRCEKGNGSVNPRTYSATAAVSDSGA